VAHFGFVPGNDGWADITIGDSWTRASTKVGYLDDPLPAILGATIQLLDGAEVVSIRFNGEPPDTRWSFQRIADPHGHRAADMLGIALAVDYDELEETGDGTYIGNTTFGLRVYLEEFATAVLNGTEFLRLGLGESGYSQRWTIPSDVHRVEFPSQLLEELRNRLASRGVQSDLEWIKSEGWSLAVGRTDEMGSVSVTIKHASTAREVSGQGPDLASAVDDVCSWVRTGMPDCR
jgi:hypothetical protein